MASNCTLKDNKVHVKLREVFQILADGAVKEAEMEAAGASKEAIEKEWLPRVDSNLWSPARPVRIIS